MLPIFRSIFLLVMVHVMQMAYFKVPRYWLFTQSSFPATTAGKVQKFALKEMAIKELGL